MKRRFTRILAAVALLLFMAPSMVGWGQENYVVGFASTTTNNDGSATISTLTDIVSSGTDYITSITNANKVYKGKQGYGVKLGSSSAVGSFVMNLSDAGKVEATSIVFNSCKYGTDNSSLKITINGNITQTFTLTSNLANYTYTFNEATEITSIKIEGVTKRIYVKSMTVNYGGVPAPTCATPTFSPAAGTYYGTQQVTISCATSGATVYYTTNGTNPTTSSSVYSTPIEISQNTTVKAMGVKAGMDNSTVAEASYIIQPTVFNQDWEGQMNGWTFVSVTGDQVWNVSSYQSNHYAKMSGYSGGNYANEDWCISPAFNLEDYTNPVLTFTTARSQHNGNELEVYFSNNYDGTNVSSATWTQLTCTLPAQPSSGYSDFISSGNISLNSYSGSNCYIGFKYTSTTSAAATWELDDIVLASQSITPTITLTPSSIDLGNNNATDVQISKTFTVSQSNLTEGIVLNATIGNLNTTTIAQGAGDTEITWTYTPSEAGNINATITATSAGAETQTLTITGAAVAPVTGDRYEMVTEAPQDWSGCYIITGTNSGDYYALTGVTSNLGTTAEVTVVGNSIQSNSTTNGYQVIVAQTTNGYSLYMDGVGYLGYNSDATSGSNNLHALESFAANTCEWTIAMTADGLAAITNVRNNGRTLQFNYNSGNSRFACYTSNQVKPTLFKYTGTVVLPPVINVTNNTVSLEYDATEGYVAYTIDNPVAGTNLAATSEADWISNISVANDKVNFTTTVNEGNSNRTATITLSYNGASDKVVTVTQGHYVAPFEGGTYTLATSVESGKTYIIVNQESNKTMGTQNENNRAAVDVVINNDTITVSSDAVYEFVIESAGEGVYSIYDARTGGYLYAASSGSNYLRTKAELDDNGKWAISIGQDAVASIVAQGTNSRKVMQYNSSSSLFSCYASASQQPVFLYEKVYVKHIGNWHTHGYYLISSPIATVNNPTNPENVANMITPQDPNNNENNHNTYDLYAFDPTQTLEWRNYRQSAFNLEAGKGYLYGNSTEGGVDLIFKGTAYSGNGQVTLTKADPTAPNANPGLDFPDWNLVGNPFAVVAYSSKPYYTMNQAGTAILGVTSNGSVEAMEGIFVKADNVDENNEEVMTFSTTPAKRGSNLSLNLTDNGSLIDRAIVSFVEGEQLPKFQLDRNSTKLYIPQDGQDYAIVCSEGMGAMPVNFKAENNGTYSLNFSTENVGFAYLHLIDNMTGRDIDLLQTPSYTFNAKTTDYANRFKLVFATGDNSNDNNFAFFSNGSFVINNDGAATLQVIDITGRIVKSESINGCANVNVNAAPGVYMLRLINGTDVKVQKVVVK